MRDFQTVSLGVMGRRKMRSDCLHPEIADPKERARIRARKWYAENKERARSTMTAYRQTEAFAVSHDRSRIKERYGVEAVAIVADLRTLQAGRCAICHRKMTLHIDHDHKTGRVRGLLCRGCNHGLGNFDDKPARLVAAIRYMTRDGA